MRERDIACGFGGLCTPPVAYNGIDIACKRNTLRPSKKIIAHSMVKISTMKLLANLRMKNLLMDGRTISNPFWGRHARNPLRFQQIVDFVVVELDAWDGVCVALSMLLIQSLSLVLSASG